MKIKSKEYSYHQFRRIYDLLKTIQDFGIINYLDFESKRLPGDNELYYRITIEMEIKDESRK